jgi:hypothetical protein
MRFVSDQLKAYKKLLKGRKGVEPIVQEADSILQKIEKWEKKLIQPEQKTFQDVINYNNKLNAELMNLKSYVDSAIPEPTLGASQRLNELLEEAGKLSQDVKQIRLVEMNRFNQMYKEAGLPALIFNEIE